MPHHAIDKTLLFRIPIQGNYQPKKVSLVVSDIDTYTPAFNIADMSQLHLLTLILVFVRDFLITVVFS